MGATPFGSGWGVLYVPFLVGLLFFWIRAEEPGLLAWAVGTGVLALVYVLAAGDPEWFSPSLWGFSLGGGVADPGHLRIIFKGVAVFVWLGCGAGLVFLSLMLRQRRRAQAEEHLFGVTIENEQRRQEMREKHGTAVADREFAVEEEP